MSDPDKTKKRKYLQLSEELCDGIHKTVVEKAEDAFESIKVFFEEASVGEGCSLEVVEMTPEEVENLPEV